MESCETAGRSSFLLCREDWRTRHIDTSILRIECKWSPRRTARWRWWAWMDRHRCISKSASDVTPVSWSSLPSEKTITTDFRLHLSDNLGKISLSGLTLANVLGVMVAVSTLLAKLHRADSASSFHTTPNIRHSVIYG
jgi:hypothetical protein